MAVRRMHNFLAVGLSLCLMGGAAVDQSFRTVPANTEPYHMRIRDAADKSPDRIGDWIGQSIETPPSAIKLLRPNVIISKYYLNYVTGQWASVLIVDCSDARDLIGHYPPNCYPSQGWIQTGAEKRDWQVGNLNLPGTQYDFMQKIPRDRSETVANLQT